MATTTTKYLIKKYERVIVLTGAEISHIDFDRGGWVQVSLAGDRIMLQANVYAACRGI